MNVKTKAIGLLAGSALAFGVATSGVLAQADTTVTLDDGDVCIGSVSETEGDINFGVYSWDGSKYVLEDGSTSNGLFQVNAANGVWDDTGTDCTVTLAVSDLEGQSVGNTSKILGSAITFTSDSAGSNPFNVTPGGLGVIVTASFNPEGVDIQPDTYTGTITVSTSTGA